MSTTGSATLLAVARDLQRHRNGLVGIWPRAVAVVTRQALEEIIEVVLATRAAGVERCSARAQLLCLPTYAPTDAAREASYLWAVLSRACHHHPYELSPTAEELEDWLTAVERLQDSLWSSAPTVQLTDQPDY
jgi:hypothetical protein